VLCPHPPRSCSSCSLQFQGVRLLCDSPQQCQPCHIPCLAMLCASCTATAVIGQQLCGWTQAVTSANNRQTANTVAIAQLTLIMLWFVMNACARQYYNAEPPGRHWQWYYNAGPLSGVTGSGLHEHCATIYA
jgi:hypothetical protein